MAALRRQEYVLLLQFYAQQGTLALLPQAVNFARFADIISHGICCVMVRINSRNPGNVLMKYSLN